MKKMGIDKFVVFMQDGAPPHFKIEVREWLNKIFSKRWIGRKGSVKVPTPIIWPPYSPDITPCDFFLWGHIKDIVYRAGVPADLEELRERIENAFEKLPQEFVDNSVDTFKKRLKDCIEKDGSHIE
jgi:hypothetical protein